MDKEVSSKTEDTMDNFLQGEALEVLKTLPERCVQTCVTSPPYWGLRDYGTERQLGLEDTPEEYVSRMVAIFHEVRRVLRDDGTLWLNLGDSYWANRFQNGTNDTQDCKFNNIARARCHAGGKNHTSLKPKDLIGIPWRVAFALQAGGWYLRQDIIWHKPNPMPESVKDRCTKSHEYIFLLSKNKKYFYNGDAIREPYGEDQRESGLARARKFGYDGKGTYQDWYNHKRQGTDWVDKKCTGNSLTFGQATRGKSDRKPQLLHPLGKNKRSVWTVPPKPYAGAHFATFPPDLIKPCILAGAPVGYTVLDPFMGSGTTATVAKQYQRRYLGIELNPDYIKLAEERLGTTQLSLVA